MANKKCDKRKATAKRCEKNKKGDAKWKMDVEEVKKNGCLINFN